jgi:hypothetical protein
METLVQLKENHLEDLTRQLHQLRVKLSGVRTPDGQGDGLEDRFHMPF